MEKRLHAVPPPPFVQRMKDESRAIEAESVQTALDAVPPRDLERLRQQLTPLAKRVCTADDRHEFTRIIHEWGMRGLPDYAPNLLWEMLYDQHRAEREAKAAPRRRELLERYPEMYAPLNPGLNIVGWSPPTLTDRISAWLRGGTPERPAPTLADKFYAFMRGTAPRR